MSAFEFKRRTYLHFDWPITRRAAQELATEPANVATHDFFPFLGYTMTTKRYKKNEEGNLEVSPKDRDIRYAAHADAAIYSYYSHLLSVRYEAELDRRGLTEVVSAFRSDRGTNIHIAKEVFDFCKQNRPCVALALDIKGFFDNLNHAVLKQAWKDLIGEQRLPDDHYAVYRSLTRYCWVDQKEARKALQLDRKPLLPHQRRNRLCTVRQFREVIRGGGLLKFGGRKRKGIPQGSPLSALLSNLYMLAFDDRVNQAVNSVGGLYRRYCDDIMVVVPPENMPDIEALIAEELSAIRLKSHPDKRQVAEFPLSGPIDGSILPYLGFTYNGETIRLRDASLNRYYGKMRRAVRLAKASQRKANQKEIAEGKPPNSLKTAKLYRRYSYLATRRTPKAKQAHGNKNFITYALRAADIMGSQAIRKQIRPHWRKLQAEIDEAP